MTAQELINIAKNEIGVKENPANSNNVKYNTWYYGKSVSGAAYPWCAAFVSWCFKSAQGLCPKTASCLTMLQWFEGKGQIVTDPRPGDIVFFHYSTNNRRTNHVGIVIGVESKIIRTVEGNTSVSSNDNGGSVMERMRNKNIVAYARPKYSRTVKKSNEEIALEVINGEWGTGVVRRQRLTQAGYDYTMVQKIVNQILAAR